MNELKEKIMEYNRSLMSDMDKLSDDSSESMYNITYGQAYACEKILKFISEIERK